MKRLSYVFLVLTAANAVMPAQAAATPVTKPGWTFKDVCVATVLGAIGVAGVALLYKGVCNWLSKPNLPQPLPVQPASAAQHFPMVQSPWGAMPGVVELQPFNDFLSQAPNPLQVAAEQATRLENVKEIKRLQYRGWSVVCSVGNIGRTDMYKVLLTKETVGYQFASNDLYHLAGLVAQAFNANEQDVNLVLTQAFVAKP